MPGRASTYAGSMAFGPVTATFLARLSLPVLRSFPIAASRRSDTVQTVSPFIIGEMWLIWTPTLPAGCFPLTMCWITFSSLWNGDPEKLSMLRDTWTPPLVSLPRAFTAAWTLSKSSLRANSGLAARGAVLKAETKMALGSAEGSATMP